MIRLNEDAEFVAEMKRQIRKNGGYCPCRREKTADTKCPCREFREMKSGICHCGLYTKEEEKHEI